MRRELVSEEELMSHLRQHGVMDLDAVQLACMEGDGRISIITRDNQKHEAPERQI